MSVTDEMKRLERTVAFVARWTWRTDPPNSSSHLTDAERLSAIKYHPVIKDAAKGHIDLADKEASVAPRQGGGAGEPPALAAELETALGHIKHAPENPTSQRALEFFLEKAIAALRTAGGPDDR